MAKKKKKKKSSKPKTSLQILKTIRNSWNGVNPVTKVIPNKKRDKQIKDEEY